jgi:hypothetical protein
MLFPALTNQNDMGSKLGLCIIPLIQSALRPGIVVLTIDHLTMSARRMKNHLLTSVLTVIVLFSANNSFSANQPPKCGQLGLTPEGIISQHAWARMLVTGWHPVTPTVVNASPDDRAAVSKTTDPSGGG